MQRDLDRGAVVLELDLAHKQQKFSELKGAISQCVNLLQGFGLVFEQVFVVLAQHAGAGAGRHDHRVIFSKQGQL